MQQDEAVMSGLWLVWLIVLNNGSYFEELMYYNVEFVFDVSIDIHSNDIFKLACEGLILALEGLSWSAPIY